MGLGVLHALGRLFALDPSKGTDTEDTASSPFLDAREERSRADHKADHRERPLLENGGSSRGRGMGGLSLKKHAVVEEVARAAGHEHIDHEDIGAAEEAESEMRVRIANPLRAEGVGESSSPPLDPRLRAGSTQETEGLIDSEGNNLLFDDPRVRSEDGGASVALASEALEQRQLLCWRWL